MNETEKTPATEVYQADKQILNSPENIENTNEGDIYFFPVSEGKLITLYILSFGLYGVYWFYKNWKLQENHMDKKIYPVWRAIFSIFFTHSLFKRIDQHASHIEKQHKFNANVLATFFVATIVVSYILDQLTMNSSMFGNMSITIVATSVVLFLLSTYPLVKVQATVNRINNDMLGYLNHNYNLWNYLLMAFGIILWIIFALGILAESMGLVTTENM